MTAQTFDRDTFECLQSIGFLSNDDTPLLMPNGEAISHPNFVRLETIAGRASNLRYMRQAMDRYDGVDQPASGTPQGDQQFDHLIKHFRSEEHTSELQSLMRTSYAVFCLKQKNKNNTQSFEH